jgi:hypothetical protein
MKQSLSSDSFIERIFIGIFPDSMPPAARKAHSAWRFAHSVSRIIRLALCAQPPAKTFDYFLAKLKFANLVQVGI